MHVIAACSQLLLKSVSKLFDNVEWSNSLLRHFKIQTLLKINFCMAAISAFRVTQHDQIFSLFFRNRIQCIALYQLHNSQALLNLRRGYFIYKDKEDTEYVNKYMENRMVRQFKRPCLLLAVTLCPISALPCQINQMSDSSRPNSCIIYRERIRAKNVISPNLAHPVFKERHRHERSHNNENCLKTLAFGLPLGLFLKV